jgi:hypothetical protein
VVASLVAQWEQITGGNICAVSKAQPVAQWAIHGVGAG